MDYKKEAMINAKVSNAANGTNYWGMDTSSYPGDSKLSDWWAHGPFWYTSFYLAPAPHHSNTSWMGKYSTVTNMGWGLLPVYVGRQSGDGGLLNFEQGRTDASNANDLAHNAGLPSSRYIYLDIEEGGILSDNFISYIQGWVDATYNNYDYMPGIYCSYKDTAGQIQSALGPGYPDVRYWIFRLSWSDCGSGTAPNPSDCGVPFACCWQGVQNIDKTYGSSTIHLDGDTSIYKDPSR